MNCDAPVVGNVASCNGLVLVVECGLVYEISSVNCMADCDNIEKRALFHNLICFFHILWIILRMFDDYYYIL